MGALWGSITNYFSTAGGIKITADILGIVITVICLISPQLKRKWQMLTMTTSANLLSAVQNLLLGAVSAVGVCFVAIIWALMGIRYSKKGESPSIWMIAIFSVLFVFSGLLPYIIANSWHTFRWFDVLPIIGALMLMCSVAQKKEQHMRLFSLGNCVIFTVHCALIGSTQIAAQIIGIVSVSTALIRYSFVPKTSEQAEA